MINIEYNQKIKESEAKKMRIDRVKLVSELIRQDMTQKELAEKAGVSRVTLSYIKCGKNCCDETAEKLAGALGVPVEKLIETE